MKRVMLKLAMLFSMALLAALVFSVTSCSKDDDTTPPAVVLDGTYIFGGSTALSTYDSKGMMKVTRNEVNQEDRSTLLELYIAIKGGNPGFSIVTVAGNVKTFWAPGADFKVVPEAERIADEPKVDFWRGSYVAGTTAFTVPTDGLYHVVIETKYKKVAILPVVWGVIGAATPGGWSSSTAMPALGFDLNTMTFQVTDLPLTKADWKFRYSDGWKVVLDTVEDLGGGKIGVRANTNFGGAVDALVPGGANINNAVLGKYTVKMVWTLGSPHAATVTKTGEIPLNDYTNTELGLVGDGLVVNGVQWNWNETVMLHKPTVENTTNYYWNYDGVEVTTAGSFKIREGQDWNGKVIGYPQVVMAGLAADKFETNGDGNFVPKENGVFDIELKIDAVTETYTFTVNPHGTTVELYMLGDGCSAGWNNAAPLPMSGTGGIYTITTTLEASKFIKFITTPGQWAPQYGTDGTGTSTGGPLVYRPTENDPDPNAIPTPATAGTYKVDVNTTALTYTITAVK